MAQTVVPHFHNQPGARVVEVGAHEFMCIGALPPNDHPHIYLDLGGDSEIVCSYCSTLYRLNPKLSARQAEPAECAWTDPVIA